MDLPTAIVTILLGALVLGYVQRFRAGSAMRFEWTRATTLDDVRLEQMIRRHLRGYLPLGRVRGTVSDGQFCRRISRFAVSLNSVATVVIIIEHLDDEPDARVVRGFMQACEVETVAVMAHPAWSPPLAARRRLRSLLRA